MKLFRCYQCGYTIESEDYPETFICPLCDEPGTSYVEASYAYVPRHLINEPVEAADDVSAQGSEENQN